jgi:hypothetical protein
LGILLPEIENPPATSAGGSGSCVAIVEEIYPMPIEQRTRAQPQ